MRPYQSYVAAQSERSPCLQNLCRFLADPSPDRNSCRIECLEFVRSSSSSAPAATTTPPIIHRRPIEPNQLQSLLLQDDTPILHTNVSLGQILIVQDITKSVMEMLGSILHIDPLFFALHVYADRQEIQIKRPDLAFLPSRARPQVFTNMHYHRTVVWEKNAVPALMLERQRLLWRANVDRKVVLLPTTKNLHVTLLQHVCSIFKAEEGQHPGRRGKGWLCLVLVDPPVSDSYISVGEGVQDTKTVEIPTEPFMGGFEDFLDPPPFSEADDSRPSGSNFQAESYPFLRHGLLDNLLYYWTREQPRCFNPNRPTMLSLSYYPLRIITAEWANYVSVMHYSAREYEYSIGEEPVIFDKQNLDRLGSDLRSLQTWRRRSSQSLHKIIDMRRFICFNQTETKKEEERHLHSHSDGTCRALLADFEHIAANIDGYGRRFESMLPIVISLIQIADSRRCYADSSNVRRLSYLAQVFVPLTFISGLFSMDIDMTPGRRQFWVYVAVALPVTFVVFLIARPPVREVRWLFGRVRSEKPSEAPVV